MAAVLCSQIVPTYALLGHLIKVSSSLTNDSVEPDFLGDGGPAEGAVADAGLALEAAADVAARQEDDVALKQSEEGDHNDKRPQRRSERSWEEQSNLLIPFECGSHENQN